jgi:hypothetical protein
MSEFGTFAPKPFPLWWPTRQAWKNRLAELDGSIPKLAAEILGRAGIRTSVKRDGVELPPDQYPWNDRQRGTLFVGCHRGGNEPAFLAALLGESGDKPLRAFGKPFAFLPQGIAELARRDDGTTDERIANTLLPLVSRQLAGDTGPAISTQRLFWWMGMRQRLPQLVEIIENTDRVFSAAADTLRQGGSMLIFPTGRIADATTTRWRPGVGRLIAECKDFADDVDVVPFRFGDYQPLRLARAVMLGQRASDEPVDIHLAPTYTAESLLNSREGRLGHVALTREMQSRYIEEFAPEQVA